MVTFITYSDLEEVGPRVLSVVVFLVVPLPLSHALKVLFRTYKNTVQVKDPRGASRLKFPKRTDLKQMIANLNIPVSWPKVLDITRLNKDVGLMAVPTEVEPVIAHFHLEGMFPLPKDLMAQMEISAIGRGLPSLTPSPSPALEPRPSGEAILAPRVKRVRFEDDAPCWDGSEGVVPNSDADQSNSPPRSLGINTYSERRTVTLHITIDGARSIGSLPITVCDVLVTQVVWNGPQDRLLHRFEASSDVLFDAFLNSHKFTRLVLSAGKVPVLRILLNGPTLQQPKHLAHIFPSTDAVVEPESLIIMYGLPPALHASLFKTLPLEQNVETDSFSATFMVELQVPHKEAVLSSLRSELFRGDQHEDIETSSSKTKALSERDQAPLRSRAIKAEMNSDKWLVLLHHKYHKHKFYDIIVSKARHENFQQKEIFNIVTWVTNITDTRITRPEESDPKIPRELWDRKPPKVVVAKDFLKKSRNFADWCECITFIRRRVGDDHLKMQVLLNDTKSMSMEKLKNTMLVTFPDAAEEGKLGGRRHLTKVEKSVLEKKKRERLEEGRKITTAIIAGLPKPKQTSKTKHAQRSAK
ncbi:uncharacterized protein EV420DRAFT_1647404 [Desarmillaria tabescens]|uniref:Uncharacterized protein n=1 Tax=Armillaria tabescens TaxID=1929756 RepID=A0AA39JSS1_ARMTA|nr:uncharacterized protein EV420DRAFT_1647404 [Desarmillaria tabescens]KAK0448252.1 hypothetical protein EV420DRAFT_1647404 [Desarmillaria tabescens]